MRSACISMDQIRTGELPITPVCFIRLAGSSHGTHALDNRRFAVVSRVVPTSPRTCPSGRA
eukprot:1400039-Prymnesium_polylepis.1